VGAACGVGPLEASSLARDRGLWEDAAGAAAAPAARPAPPSRATAPCRVHERCPAGGLEHQPGPGARRARGMRSGPGTMAGAEAPCPPIAPGGPVSAARLAPMPALGGGLLWETPQPEGPHRPTARLRLFPLSGHRRVSLWRRTGLSAYPGTDRSSGPGGLAGSVSLAGAPRAARGGISAPLAAGDRRQTPASGHGRRPEQPMAPRRGTIDRPFCGWPH
jgi:hypothetical protein